MKNTVQDIRGITQLAVQATTGVTRITEGVHQSVLGTMGIRAGKTPEQTRGISGLVYRNIHNITRLVGKSLDTGLAQLRSAGITDLRYGHVLDEDWHGHDRFHCRPDGRQPAPLPEGVACYTLAATLADSRSTLSSRLVGDGLVPLHSALGHHEKAHRKLLFANESHRIIYGLNHMELLNSPEVIRQVQRWLTAAQLPAT